MKSELKELNMAMDRLEYEMFQDIPVKEPGSTNLCRGLPFEVFKCYLETQMARKYQTVSRFDTPTVMYLLYADEIPVGYIGVRTQIDENWKIWSGNIYYTVRSSCRGRGYGRQMLKLALEECRRMGMEKVLINASAGNIASARVIEVNGGVLLRENQGSRYYEIVL